jgi:hypothetical protein
MHRYLALLLLAVLGGASVLITNGDYEQDLSVGWEQTVNGSNTSILRATNYDPDPDYEAYAYKGTGDGFAKLFQLAHIPTTDLDFSATIKLLASSNSTTCWAGAAFVITYMDDAGDVLGETMICRMSPASTWTNTPTRHLIAAADTNWNNYAFNINAELADLPGINPADVARIEVSLYGFADSG